MVKRAWGNPSVDGWMQYGDSWVWGAELSSHIRCRNLGQGLHPWISPMIERIMIYAVDSILLVCEALHDVE